MHLIDSQYSVHGWGMNDKGWVHLWTDSHEVCSFCAVMIIVYVSTEAVTLLVSTSNVSLQPFKLFLLKIKLLVICGYLLINRKLLTACDLLLFIIVSYSNTLKATSLHKKITFTIMMESLLP